VFPKVYIIGIDIGFEHWMLTYIQIFYTRDHRLEKVSTKSGNKFRTWNVGKHTGSAALARRFAGRPEGPEPHNPRASIIPIV
jgi:hypothetical protein